jgi:hypothetical protein
VGGGVRTGVGSSRRRVPGLFLVCGAVVAVGMAGAIGYSVVTHGRPMAAQTRHAVGLVVLLVGVAVLVVAGLTVWLLGRRRVRHLESEAPYGARHPDLACGVVAARAGTAPVEAWVVGRAETDGVTAPVSGRRCAWYHARVSVLRNLVRDRYQSPMYKLIPVRDWSSDAPFALADGTGRVGVEPAGLALDFAGYLERTRILGHQGLPPGIAPHYASDRRTGDAGEEELWEEWTVEPGELVHVHGTATANGGAVTLAAGTEPFTVSFRDATRRHLADVTVQDTRRDRRIVLPVAFAVVLAVVAVYAGARMLL